MLITSAAVASLLFVAAITPGPNNFIVLSVASRQGFLKAMPAIFGVVAGSLGLAVLIWSGTSLLTSTVWDVLVWLKFLGCGYLCWLGISLILSAVATPGSEKTEATDSLPSQFAGVALFQALNPKTWVLLTTVVASAKQQGLQFAFLAGLMTVIMASCLALWAGLGSTISTGLKNPRAQQIFDISMGGLLIVSAGLLFL